MSMELLEEFVGVYLQKIGRLELKCVIKKCNLRQFFGPFKYVITCAKIFLEFCFHLLIPLMSGEDLVWRYFGREHAVGKDFAEVSIIN